MDKNALIGSDLLPIWKVLGSVKEVTLNKISSGVLIEFKDGPGLKTTRMMFIGYDFSARLHVTYEVEDNSVFSKSQLVKTENKV